MKTGGAIVCVRWLVTALVGCLSLLAASPAGAELYEHTFTGQVRVVYGSVPDPWQDVHHGSDLAFSYVFDTEMEDLVQSPNIGVYELIQFSVTLEGAMQWAPGGKGIVNTTPIDEFEFQNTESLPIGGSCW